MKEILESRILKMTNFNKLWIRILKIEVELNFPSEISRNFNHLKSYGNSKFHHREQKIIYK